MRCLPTLGGLQGVSLGAGDRRFRVPMQAEPAVVLVRRVADPDFGSFELWRGHFLEWRGKAKLPDGEEAPIILPVDDGVEADAMLGYLTPAARATLTRLIASEAKVRRRVCESKL